MSPHRSYLLSILVPSSCFLFFSFTRRAASDGRISFHHLHTHSSSLLPFPSSPHTDITNIGWLLIIQVIPPVLSLFYPLYAYESMIYR